MTTETEIDEAYQRQCNLINAAPDLLKALENLLDVFQRCDAGYPPNIELRFLAIDEANMAIAKAKGEYKKLD